MNERVGELRRMLDAYQRKRTSDHDAEHRSGRAGAFEIDRTEGGWGVVRSGFSALDDALPRGGFVLGTVVDCLYRSPGAGAMGVALRLALAAAGGTDKQSLPVANPTTLSLQAPHRPIVVVDTKGDFYPPACERLGFDLDRLVVVCPRTPADAFWATDQCLRCRGVASVVASVGDLDEVCSRRLQLAAECGGGLGVMLSRLPHREGSGRKSFAAVRILVEPSGRGGSSGCLRMTLVRVREGRPAGPFEVELPDEAGFVSAHTLPADRTPKRNRRTPERSRQPLERNRRLEAG